MDHFNSLRHKPPSHGPPKRHLLGLPIWRRDNIGHPTRTDPSYAIIVAFHVHHWPLAYCMVANFFLRSGLRVTVPIRPSGDGSRSGLWATVHLSGPRASLLPGDHHALPWSTGLGHHHQNGLPKALLGVLATLFCPSRVFYWGLRSGDREGGVPGGPLARLARRCFGRRRRLPCGWVRVGGFMRRGVFPLK